MSLKIAGVAGGKHPTLKKGDIIELSPENKIEIMAKEEVSKRSPEGFRFIPIDSKVIGDVKVLVGRKDIKKPEPDQYLGTVEITYRSLNLFKDRLYQPKTTLVKVHCKDCKNDIGVPDLEMIEFKVLK